MSVPSLENCKDLIIYEIFVQGFTDTNGDGIGDLRGVIDKVDYIEDLGFNAIWLGPIFDSPWDDGGYDVRDYYKIAPRYGTMDDIRTLIEILHKKGMKLIMDMVPGHTSYQHEWFQQSSKTTPNEYSDRYIWTSNVWEVETVPEHNYLKGFTRRDGNVMTNFFYCQPALNYGFYETKYPWEQKMGTGGTVATKEAMVDVIRHYFQMGVDGFRVDMADSLIKRDPERKGITALWNEIRATFDKEFPDRFLIAEWSDPLQSIPAGFHIDMLIHFNCYIGSKLIRYETWAEQGDHGPNKHSYFRAEGKGDFLEFLAPYREIREKTQGKGFISIPVGNHDVPRASLGRTQEELKVLYTFLLTFPHVPIFYYGDEIGLEYVQGVDDIECGYNRTGARNCMHWSAGKNGGFSAGDSLLMPIGDYEANNLEKQKEDENSLYHFVKQLIALRKATPALGSEGDIEFIYAEKNAYPLIIKRSDGKDTYFVIVNAKDKSFSYDLGQVVAPVLASGIALEGTKASIGGISYGVFRA